MIKALITGGTGFLGSALVKELIKRNYKVIVFDNNFRGSVKNLNEVRDKIKFIKGDIRNFTSVKKAVKGVDEVYHLAFINGTSYFYKFPKLVLDVGIKGTLNVMDAINQNKRIKKFIYASSSEIYQKPNKFPTDEKVQARLNNTFNPRYSYAASKILGEVLTFNYLRKGVKKIIFRPHNIYGPSMGFEHAIPQIIKKIIHNSNKLKKKSCSIVIEGSGKESRSFCHVNDAVEAIYYITKKGLDNEIYNVGKNEEIKIINLIKLIAKEMDIKTKIIHSKLKLGSTKRRVPDIKKLKKLGFSPKINLIEGLHSTINWYKKYYLKNV